MASLTGPRGPKKCKMTLDPKSRLLWCNWMDFFVKVILWDKGTFASLSTCLYAGLLWPLTRFSEIISRWPELSCSFFLPGIFHVFCTSWEHFLPLGTFPPCGCTCGHGVSCVTKRSENTFTIVYFQHPLEPQRLWSGRRWFPERDFQGAFSPMRGPTKKDILFHFLKATACSCANNGPCDLGSAREKGGAGQPCLWWSQVIFAPW